MHEKKLVGFSAATSDIHEFHIFMRFTYTRGGIVFAVVVYFFLNTI